MNSRRLRFAVLVSAAAGMAIALPASVGAQDVQAVPGPSNLQATAASPSQIDLSWNKVSTSQVTEYVVYYSDGTEIARLSSSQSGYSDTELRPWTTYRYYVTGANSSGNESPPSNVASARTLDGTPPTKPGNLAGSAVSQTQISLTWTAASDPESGIDEYTVYRDGSEIGRTSNLTYLDNGLAPDHQYSYEVSAVNGAGDVGSRAGPIEVRTPADQTPDPPTGLSGTAVSASAVDLSWNPPADDSDVVSYRVYRNGSRVATISGTSYRNTGLASYTSYEYWVTSVDGDGDESGPSSAVTVRTLDGTLPTKPGNLAGSAVSRTQISLTWTAASDPQTGISEYVVFRDGSEIARTAALSYEDGGLESDQLYRYEVSAVNSAGDVGSRAGPIEVRTLSAEAPDPPTGLSATAIDPNTVDLTWNIHPDHDNLDGYRIYRDGSFVASTSGTTYRDVGLTPFTTYVYTLTAVGEDGDESSPSQPASVTTPDFTPPSIPEDLVATAVGTERIDLTWSPSSDPESGVFEYVVFRDGGEISRTTTTSFQDGGLTPGTTYEYRVSAINGAGDESDPSLPVSATTPGGSGPSAPTNLSATPVSTESIELFWSPSTDPESGIAFYRVFRDGTEIGTPTGTDYQDAGLEATTTYEYRVSAVNGDGLESDLSPAVSATTFDAEGPPAPTGLTATPSGPSQVGLTWVAPDGGASSYNVFRDGTFIGSVMATAFVDTGLQPATTYRYAVASVDADGIQGARSGEVSATTPSSEDLVPPAPPTGLRVVNP